MPSRLHCRYCDRVGLVRVETIMTRGQVFRQYYCGACNKSWEIDAGDPTPPEDPPERTRTPRLRGPRDDRKKR